MFLKCYSGIFLAAKLLFASLVQVHLERVLLIAFEDRIFHDLQHYILKLQSPEIEILITSWVSSGSQLSQGFEINEHILRYATVCTLIYYCFPTCISTPLES